MQRLIMYLSETLARDRSSDLHEQARQTRIARQAAELRKLERLRQRAERKLLRAWQRADELRASIEAVG
jgi:hypothetical protein